jgi:hypothetical protein
VFKLQEAFLGHSENFVSGHKGEIDRREQAAG